MSALTIQGRSQSPVLDMIRRKFPEYHPLMSLAEIAHTTDDDKLAVDCHKTIAKYVEPELKSLEVKPPPDDRRRVAVTLFDVIEDAHIIPMLPEPS